MRWWRMLRALWRREPSTPNTAERAALKAAQARLRQAQVQTIRVDAVVRQALSAIDLLGADEEAAMRPRRSR